MQYRGLQLDPFQAQSIQAIDEGKSVIVAAPTGTGKTLIADYLVDQVLSRNGSAVYTAPIKALSNQKYREYCKLHGPENVGLITGDSVINPSAPLQIMTTEILRNILLQTPETRQVRGQVEDIQAVIFDELHFLDDPDRGTVWEEVIIYLPDSIQILGLSATLSNLDELSGWLSTIREGVAGEVAVIVEEKRAVPLTFLLANREKGLVTPEAYSKNFKTWRRESAKQERKRSSRQKRNEPREKRSRNRRSRRDEDSTNHRDMVRLLHSEDLPALFFMFSRRATELCAKQLSRSSKQGYLTKHESLSVRDILDAFDDDSPDILQPTHRSMYTRGIAFHHAGLHVSLKHLVETLYEQRLIKVLYCTSTFALGINMPARTVLFESLEKFNGQEIAPLTVRQFMQKAGRAGRRGLDDSGQVIIRMDFKDWRNTEEHLRRLMSAPSEPVRSSFNLSFHSVVNLLNRFDEDHIRDLLGRSFLAFQRASDEENLRSEIALQEAHLKLVQNDSETETTVAEKRANKRLNRLKRRLAKHQDWLWKQFQTKVDFLQQVGYITPDGEFTAGAKIIQNIQIEEFYITELILSGIFEDMNAAEIFGVCTGLVSTLPRQTRISADLPDAIFHALDTIQDIYESPYLAEACDLTGGEPHCDPAMMALGSMWADGLSMPEISHAIRSSTDILGDLIGAFRRAKELMGQIRLVYWHDDARRIELRNMIRFVTRDEVEALG